MRDKGALNRYLWWSIAVAMAIGCGINLQSGLSGYDWVRYFYPAGQTGDVDASLFPSWLHLVLWPLSRLPLPASYLVFCLLNIVMIAAASHLIGSNRFLLLLSFPAFWVLWYGQLDAFVLLGVALGWKAIEQENPVLMGSAIPLLLVKPHIGGPLALLYLLWFRRRETIYVLAALTALCMLIWGWDWVYLWGRNLVLAFQGDYLVQATNISLYPYGLLAWLGIVPNLPRSKKVIVAMAATLLSTPYAPVYSILPLLGLPIPWWIYLLGSAPFLFGPDGYWITSSVPLLAIAWVMYSQYGLRLQSPSPA